MDIYDSIMQDLSEAVAFEQAEKAARSNTITSALLPEVSASEIKEPSQSLNPQNTFPDVIGVKERESMSDIIDRDTYRKIKKMSREELQAFLIRYANNISADHSIDLRVLENDLKAVKGIGEKRLEDIMVIIEKHLGV